MSAAGQFYRERLSDQLVGNGAIFPVIPLSRKNPIFRPLHRLGRSQVHCWVVDTSAPMRMGSVCKAPLTEPDTVLAHLSRYTHRVAIAKSRLVARDKDGLTFCWKD